MIFAFASPPFVLIYLYIIWGVLANVYCRQYKLRGVIDLRDWEDEIIDSVHDILPSASINVFENSYQILSPIDPTDGQLRAIGKKIASNPHIGQHAITHLYGKDDEQRSGKLFIRKK